MSAPAVGPRVAFASYALGILSGILVAFIVRALAPESPDVAQYRAVRDFAREAFVREVSDEELSNNALRGMLAALDPYSRFYDREQAQQSDREIEGRFRGIGVVFRRPLALGQILYPLPGSPAQVAGLRVGDTFLELEGRAVAELSEEELRHLLREPSGPEIEARVRALDGSERDVSIVPQVIVDPSVRHARLVDAERGIGYLAIRSFTSETLGEFDATVEYLRELGCRALVIDLRHNLGGELEAAVAVAGRFLERGTVVTTEGRGAPVVYEARSASARFADMPLVLLVDGNSASASEVLSAALQDHRLAVLVGEPTYGKGMVQTIRSYARFGTRAKVTSAYYYSPARRNFERSVSPTRTYGILPDVAVPLAADERALVHAYLGDYSPAPEVLPALAEWAAAERVPLIESPPADRQLDAAVRLFRGQRPEPARIAHEK